MACKYKYKNKWYSEIEVKNQILKDISLDEVVVELSTQMSYTVEVNTAKTNYKKPIVELGRFNPKKGWEIIQDGVIDSWYSTKQDALDTIERKNNLYADSENTQHYSNLTVPGGTNYTENEIATPNIIPSIKGHAQFATPNGIGWFRSDESQQYQETDIQSIIDNLQKSGQLEINCK